MTAETPSGGAELTDLFSVPPGDLHPDLLPYVVETERWFGAALKHPLIYQVPYVPQMNRYITQQYQRKLAALQNAIRRGAWATVVFLHERPYRINAFLQIAHQLGDKEYWELLGHVWIDTENAWQNTHEWREALSADRAHRELMSSEEARAAFTLDPEDGGLPPSIKVYRGYRFDEQLRGFAWTLDKALARWFAARLADPGDPGQKVASGWVAREHVIAYITDRDEQEIVVLPEHVEDLRIETLDSL